METTLGDRTAGERDSEYEVSVGTSLQRYFRRKIAARVHVYSSIFLNSQKIQAHRSTPMLHSGT